MSQQDVELLEALFAGAQSLDKEAMLAALPQLIPEMCDPEVVWVEDPTRADSRTYRGHEGVRASWERWLENFDEYGVEVESMSDHGDRVLVTGVEHGRGRASGAEVSARVYVLCTFRAGKILRYQEFYDEQDALAALER
jgi:ketosteroid isomerase-like protein